MHPHALHPSRTFSLILPMPQIPTVGLLLCLPFKFQLLKANVPFPLYFLTCIVLQPQLSHQPMVVPSNPTVSALHGKIGRAGAICMWFPWLAHGGRGQSRWRVGGWRLVLVVVFCVCIVLCWSSLFSYRCGKPILAKATWLTFVQSHHKKSSTPPNRYDMSIILFVWVWWTWINILAKMQLCMLLTAQKVGWVWVKFS